MTRRFAPLESIVPITDYNRNSLMPRHEMAHHAVAYLKGHNGHYYLITPWKYGDPYVIRLYTKNQLRSSDKLSINLDRSDVMNDAGQLTRTALREFTITVNDHRAHHYVPKVVDYQRRSCYAWEAAWSHTLFERGQHHGFTTVEKCTKYVEIICAKEGVKVPEIRYTKKGSSSCAWGDRKLKFLVRSDDTIPVDTIIHELAHIIDSSRGRNRAAEAGHGPKFIGVYIDLLVRYAGTDRTFLETTARQHGLRIDYDRAAA